MNHPELFAAPVLMLADYFLTILSAKSAAVVYRKHFTTPTLELNPLWRTSVDNIQWFNPRHLALTALVTLALVLIDQLAESLDFALELALGMLFGAFVSVCGRHLTNLLLFRYLNRRPDEISGEVRLSMNLLLKISQFHIIGTIPLLILIVMIAPGVSTFGVLLGVCSLAYAHNVWARKTKARETVAADSSVSSVSSDAG